MVIRQSRTSSTIVTYVSHKKATLSNHQLLSYRNTLAHWSMSLLSGEVVLPHPLFPHMNRIDLEARMLPYARLKAVPQRMLLHSMTAIPL